MGSGAGEAEAEALALADGGSRVVGVAGQLGPAEDVPVHLVGWTTADVELHGATIPADSRVVLITGAANHDERRYDAPGLFDIHRHIDRPVGFGFGVHLCLGAALARLETRVAFDELLDRFPEYELGDTGIERMRSSNVRGLKHLPIAVG